MSGRGGRRCWPQVVHSLQLRCRMGRIISLLSVTVCRFLILSIFVLIVLLDALIYPGLGFGAMLCQARKMTDTMIIAGARRLAELSPALEDPDNALLPDFEDAPQVNFEVAVAVAEQGIEEGSAGVDWSKEEVRAQAKAQLWEPVYAEYVYDPHGEA